MGHTVKLYPENRILLIWCEEHQKFHKMAYNYLLDLVPAEPHSSRGY